jgi:hypothetical protein
MTTGTSEHKPLPQFTKIIYGWFLVSTNYYHY